MKVALINDEINNTMNSIRYVLKYGINMSEKKKSDLGRLLVKLEKAEKKVARKIEVENV